MEAGKSGIEIRASCLPDQLGVFCTEGLVADACVGYYWGTIRLLADKDEEEQYRDNARLVATVKTMRREKEPRLFLYVDGSKRCAVSYINDPRGTGAKANVYFDELTMSQIDGEYFRIIRVVASTAIAKGSELFLDYGNKFDLPEVIPRTDDVEELPPIAITPAIGEEKNAEYPDVN